MKKIIVLACSKSKAQGRLPAKDLYQGALFKKTYELALLMKPDMIIIISGKSKVDIISPEDIISSYDGINLYDLGKKRRLELASRRIQNMAAYGCDLQNDHFTFFTGKLYYEFIIDNRPDPLPHCIPHQHVALPLQHCSGGIGEMLHYLNEQLKSINNKKL